MSEFWIGVIVTLVVGIPVAYAVAILAHMHAPRLAQYFESRQLLKKHKTRQQALVVFNRLKDFNEGKQDRNAHYIPLSTGAIISSIIASTLVLFISIRTDEYPVTIEYGLLAALISISCAVALALLGSIYETARQLSRFDDYKAEFEARWGPVDAP